MAKPVQKKVYKKNKPIEARTVLSVSIGQAKPKPILLSDQFLHNYELIISTLSPVHIGCGEDFEPTNYVIYSNKLHYFSESTLASVLSDADRQRLLQLIDGKNNPLADVQKFISDKASAIINTGNTKQVLVSDSVASKYNNSVGRVVHQGNKAINALEIERTSYHPHSGLPFLAGSSIKGSIRTALLNMELQKRSDLHGLKQDAKRVKDLEKDLLDGSFNTDPLRLVKVGDAAYQVKEGRAISQVRWQINKAKKRREDGKETQASIKTMLECIPEQQEESFTAQLSIQAVGQHQKNQKPITPIVQYSKDTLVKACNDYYLKEWQKERQILERLGYVDTAWLTWVDGMLAETGSFGKLIASHSGMLLRVGKHTGAETITLDKIASIKIMGKNGNSSRQSETTTVWLASENDDASRSHGHLLPFGWVFVQVKPMR